MTTSIEELKVWCLRYKEWKDICNDASKIGGSIGSTHSSQEWKDDTHEAAYILEHALVCVSLIEKCSELAGENSRDILLAVTEDIPCQMLGVSEECYGRFYEILYSRKKNHPYYRR